MTLLIWIFFFWLLIPLKIIKWIILGIIAEKAADHANGVYVGTSFPTRRF